MIWTYFSLGKSSLLIFLAAFFNFFVLLTCPLKVQMRFWSILIQKREHEFIHIIMMAM